MKALSKILLAVYLATLLWLLLFKFAPDWSAALGNTNSLNLVPFAHYSRANPWEMILNLIVFIPFGLLLGVNLKRTGFLQKLAFVLMFSLAAEILQFVLGVGVTDITDIITNTSGGFLGLVLYGLNKKYFDNEKLDQFITISSTILIAFCIAFLSTLMSRGVRYQSAPPMPGRPRLQR